MASAPAVDPGETQIETDRRLIDRRIAELKKRLADVEKRRERTVSARREQMTVSIVGYTNAGKSTLMNALTGAEVYVADKLFATLDTRTRRWQLPKWGEVLFSDTVGFVRNLPHDLVASFRSTLEEATARRFVAARRRRCRSRSRIADRHGQSRAGRRSVLTAAIR